MSSIDPTGPQEGDLDSTDKLPILAGIEALGEDAVSHTALQPVLISASALPDFARPSPVDLPALAESVRTVEERIARQAAAYEALNRLYERSRDAESAATARASALAGELARASSALAVEQHRAHEMERGLADKAAAAEAARTRLEETLRAIERHESEVKTLREALAARDATIMQVLHSLGERDAQLSALQREHAQIVPALEARSQRSSQLELEWNAERERAEALVAELAATRSNLATLEARLAQAEGEIRRSREETLAAARQKETYLEVLRTREFRRGFNENLAREWDEKAALASADRGALLAERNRLKETAAALSTKVIDQEAMLARKQQEFQDTQRARTDLASRHSALESECARLASELDGRDRSLIEARAQNSGEAQRLKERLTTIEAESAERQARIEQLEAEAQTHEEEMTVLLAHLNEARRPVQTILADVKRLNDEIVLKDLNIEQLTEDNRELQTALERTRGALEEREFLIRRLERSESNNASALGRLQTTIEKLGAAPPLVPPVAEECSAELHRIDSEAPPHLLARRTRIGRAPGCELQIDSSSVSRYHALLLKGPREVIIEDLNSTNGVIVNGRQISRQLLSDGDLVTIGDIKFRLSVRRPGQAALGTAAGAAAATGPGGSGSGNGGRPGGTP